MLLPGSPPVDTHWSPLLTVKIRVTLVVFSAIGDKEIQTRWATLIRFAKIRQL